MAGTVISVDCSDDEYGYLRNVTDAQNLPDKEEISNPPVKTIRRGLARQKTPLEVELKQFQADDSELENASEMFRFKSGPIDMKLLHDSCSDEEVKGFFQPKAKTKRGRRKNTQKVIRPSKTIKLDESIVILDDEDNDVAINRECVTSPLLLPPTPPAPLDGDHGVPQTKRPRRQTRALKSTINKLTKVKGRFKSLDNHDSDISLIDVTSPKERSEILVKVRSRSGIQRFPLLFTDSFATVIRMMAQHERVPEDQVVMFLNDTTIQSYDSPASLKLHIADIIECRIRGKVRPEMSSSVSSCSLESDPDAISLRIQGRDTKGRLTVFVKRREPLQRIMLEFASSQNKQFTELEFQFDAETISGSDSAESLDLEDGYCIDVNLVRR